MALPPFRRVPYDASQATSRMSDLVLRGGDIRAQGELRGGAIWGGMVNQLGQIAGKTLGDLAAYREEAPRREAQQLALGKLRREHKGVIQPPFVGHRECYISKRHGRPSAVLKAITALLNARAWAAVRPLPMEYMRRRPAVYDSGVPLLLPANTKNGRAKVTEPTTLVLLAASDPPR